MKIIKSSLAILSLAFCCYGDDKVTVRLNDGSYSTSGGSGRAEKIKVEIRRGIIPKPISTEEKIAALKEKLRFYELMHQHNVDLNRKINAVYTDKQLKIILTDLIPNVPVKFDGVDPKVTVESMTIAKTSLEKVCEYLDAAAGVYFRFTDAGISVVATSATK